VVLETSPRMSDEYREMMRRHFDYRASDFDLGAHRADVQIDLQDIALPGGSLDVVLTPHVLEHVPDTDRALRELYRVMRSGGRVFLQVPLLHGVTAAPTTPEFHADNTPVFWNFGWDLTGRLRAAGFTTSVLVTSGFAALLTGRQPVPAPDGDIFDVADMVRHARPADLTVVATDAESISMGWLPSHQFVTWECRKP
jgi:SAM-dependent methyltransferase